jgi:hypothetical protein
MGTSPRTFCRSDDLHHTITVSLQAPKHVFGWVFQPTFTFAKVKSQPKSLNVLGAFTQKYLSP